MNLDWKAISASEGYQHFKRQYISSVKRHARDKQECYQQFQRIIGLAKNNASYRDEDPTTAVIAVLKEFSEQCDYWYFNFYPKRKFKTACSGVGVRGEIKHCKKSKWYKKSQRSQQVVNALMREDKRNRTDKCKSRWKHNPFKIRERKRKESVS